ncbi:MAG: hypothetical protein OER88_10000, partial [Planctomycetota bacterium]|nr:hypothetical protein [Planctomycetota bacterium]
LLSVIKAHGREIWRFATRDKGTSIATGSLTIRFWPMTRKGLLDLATKRLCRDFTPEERKKYTRLLAK